MWSLFYSIRVYASLYFLPILLENKFFCLSAFFLFSACSEFDVIFMNFCNICKIIIYIVGVRYSVFLVSLITFQLSNLWEQIHVIKTWLQLLIKNMPPRSIWVLKIQFIKKSVEHLQMRECEKTLSANIYIFLKKFKK